MKNSKLVSFTIFASIIFSLTSCKNTQSPNDAYTFHPNYIIARSDYGNIGTWHNNAVAYGKLHFDPNATYAQTIRPTLDTMVSLVNTNLNSAFGSNWLFDTPITEEADSFQVIHNAGSASYFNSRWYGTNGWRNNSNLTSYLSSAELAIVDSAVSFMVTINSISGSLNNVCDSVTNKANSLLATYNSETWTDESGSLASGIIRIMLASASANHTRIYYKGGGRPLNILAADAIGYIIGWVTQLVRDAGSPGGVTPAGQGKRIEAGLAMAANLSLGAFFGR